MTHLGIDIGGTSTKAAVWIGGRWAHTGQSPFYAKPTASELRTAIRAAVGTVGAIDRVGLCVPGLMDASRTKVLMSVNVPGLVGLELDRLVPEALGLIDPRPTVVSNDAAATAHDLSQQRAPAGRLFVLTLGTGVGAAVLDDGVPLDVEGGTPGHVGQFDVSIPGHDVVGPDGGAGGLEGYVGVAALKRRYGNDVSAAIAQFTGDEPPFLAVVRALRLVHAIYRPDHIVISGGIGIRLRPLLPVLRQRVDDCLTSVARSGYTLTCGDDDFHAARGAADLASRVDASPPPLERPTVNVARQFRTRPAAVVPPTHAS